MGSATGVADLEPGFTIEDMWRTFLRDGWWPAVVPGTMFPTIGGIAAMNVHGKNCFKVGPWGDHIVEADLVAPDGNVYRTSRTENEELFNAAIGGFGMLGAFSRLRVQLKRVYSGGLRVRGHYCRDLAEQFAWFEEYTQKSDYCVSWVDCIAGGASLGRGQPHSAVYLHEGEDRTPDFDPAHQDLPGHILGVPRALVGTILAKFNTNLGMRLLNFGKNLASASDRSRRPSRAMSRSTSSSTTCPPSGMPTSRTVLCSTSPSCPGVRPGGVHQHPPAHAGPRRAQLPRRDEAPPGRRVPPEPRR